MRLTLIILWWLRLGASLALAPCNVARQQVPTHRHPSALASAATAESPTHNIHRHSASDWLYNVQSFPQSQILREIASPVLALGVWATVISVVHRLVRTTQWSRLLSVSPHAHSFVVGSIGLLLVFRTNSSYARFYEGRKIWESILSLSRNLSRMVQLYEQDIGSNATRRLLHLTAAFPYLLRMHIRPQCLCDSNQPDDIPSAARLELETNPSPHVETRHEGALHVSSRPKRCFVDQRRVPWNLFRKQDIPRLVRAVNKPLWVTDRMAQYVADISYSPNFTSRERLALLGMVDKLSNTIGQCERIHQTAVPLNYARHSLRSLTFWLFTLPFALVKDLGLLTGPATACIAWLLYGIYQIGYQIEDPFQRSLRLSILCDAIRDDVLQRVRRPSMEDDEQLSFLQETVNVKELLDVASLDRVIVNSIRNTTELDVGFQ